MKTTITVIAIVVLVAVVGFGAYDYGQSVGETNAQNIRADFVRSRTTTGGQTDTTQQGQQSSAARARPLATGAIQSISGNIMQVTQQDSSVVTVVLSDKTVVEKTVAGAQSDLKPGIRVTVSGTQATGQVDAQTIQIMQASQ